MVIQEVVNMRKKKKPEIYPNMPISVDPFGSYTGRPKDGDTKPVQDADDL
jgi:hypothetical protein